VLDLFNKLLVKRQDLTVEQVSQAVNQLVDDTVTASLKADFLCQLAFKGESAGEIAAFADELRARAIEPPIDAETRSREILDVCGTGGDKLNTFNISSTVAIVCSAAGVTVAKHGNRAVTSQSGSADVLETLGIKTELSPELAAQSLRTKGFAFFFAPLFHPVFRSIAPARKICADRGQRTIFNFMGPLLNPARPSAQLMGVSRSELCPTLAEVLKKLGVRRGMVISGRVGDSWLDELSTLGDSTISEFYQNRGFATSTVSPAHFPILPATLADLEGGTREVNAAIILRILKNEDRGPKRDAVLLNAGAGLFVAGKVKSIAEGWDLADTTISTGKAFAKLEELRS
jgi:anthranilate phosphoribosyltransferase